MKILHFEICTYKNDILYKEIILIQGEQTYEAVHEGFDVSNKNDEETHRKLDYAIEGINNIDKKIDGIEKDETRPYEISIENRAKEYADKWDKNVFLDDFDEEDERAGDRVNVKLKDIYLEKLLPSYILNENRELSYKLKARLKKYIVDKTDRKMFLILGQPGIGKSTLITWIMANLVEKKEDIYVYQFASDLKEVDWRGDDILEEIFETLRLGDEDLKNKVLILDGFDEISISGNRERILNMLYQELKRTNCLGNFSLIITCRENYVDCSRLKVKDYITLQAWNEEQIKSFCEIYNKKSIGENVEIKCNRISETKIIKILEKKEILGIPLILYMVLALNVDIEKGSSMMDIYDQIFSLERGSIYDRCYDVEHRINSPEIKNYIHQVSQRIAFWIFENNSEKASIPQKEFKKICYNVINDAGERVENLQSDVLIGNYFTTIKHCEGVGTDELQFVHRSIYEYFVTVHFFESIHRLTSKKEVAGELGELLKDGQLSEQMLEFIKCMFDNMEGYCLPDITKEVFNIMLRDGMTYYVKKKYKNIIVREMNVFSNMLDVVLLWNLKLGKLDNNIVLYLKHNRLNKLNLIGVSLIGSDLKGVNLNGSDLRGADLRKVELRRAELRRVELRETDLRGADLRKAYLIGSDLKGADLRGAYLIEADLRNAYLGETDLRGACLIGAYLCGAHLRGADLREADLRNVDLRGADLSGTIFDEKQVNELCRKYNINDSRVYISDTNEIISYKENCMRKQ